MRASLLIVFLCWFGIVSFSQKLPEIRKPKILIIGSAKDGIGNFTADDISGLFEDQVQDELKHQITCAEFMTYQGIKQMLILDRTKTILTNDIEGNLSLIAGAMGCDYLISLGGYRIGDDYYLTGSTSIIRDSKVATRGINTSDKDHFIQAMRKYAQDLARDLLARGICPYLGTISMSTERTSDEIHETGSRCGKDNSGYFRGTIKKSNSYLEEVVLEKRSRIQATGSMHVSGVEENMNREIKSGCVNCWTYEGKDVTGIDMTNYTSSDYTVVIREEFKVDGLAPLKDGSNTSKQFPAEVSIEFDTIQGTYEIVIKAVSLEGEYVKSRKVTNITECQKDPEPDEKETYGQIVSVKSTWGPFKGKPTDKTLQDSKTETDNNKIDGGQTTYTSKVNFSFTR
jgi:hypothetical protein